MPDEVRDLEKDIKINRFKLDVECERHVDMYHYWAEVLATAKSALDEAKNHYEYTRSKTELEIRRKMERGDIAIKQTEATVKACLDVHEDVMSAMSQLLTEQENVYHAQAAINALDHRRSQLDNLTQLNIRAMYAAPSGGKNVAEGLGDQAANQARANLNSKPKED